MLNNQEELNFSPHAELYDKLIPQNHFFRQIKELVDFSFIREELRSKYCLNNGRTAEDPVRMFIYLLLKCINPLSDVDLVERARFDLSYKFLLGLNPEDDVIDSSSLSKFRKLRLKDSELLDMLIEKTCQIAIEKGVIRTKSIIIDSTHTKSRYNSHPIREVLQEQSKKLRHAVYETDEKTKVMMPPKNAEDSVEKEVEYCEALVRTIEAMPVVPNLPAVKEKLNLLKETMEDTKEELYQSRDEDAKIGHKTKDTSFFGYKTHIAMTPERIICAATVTSGEKPDGKELPELVRKSRRNGIDVRNVIGDRAYSGKDNLELAGQADENGEDNFKLISRLNPVITDGNRNEEENGFIYNKDAGTYQCKAGFLADSINVKRAKRKGHNIRYSYNFSKNKCEGCPFRDECKPEKGRGKRFTVTVMSEAHKRQKEFQETEDFKLLSKERYKIEAKNSELKNVHGYGRSVGNGLYSTKIQGACTIFAANIKRIITILDEK